MDSPIGFFESLLQYGFSQFLDLNLSVLIDYTKTSSTIKKEYLNQLRKKERNLNKKHTETLKKIKETFKKKFSELKELNPNGYEQKKIRHMHVAEQKLLYEELIENHHSPIINSLFLKQPDGNFTPYRLLESLIYQNDNHNHDIQIQKKILLEETSDDRLIHAFLHPTDPPDSLTAFANEAISHLKTKSNSILKKHQINWQEGNLYFLHKQLSLKEKKTVTAMASVAYTIALTKIQKTIPLKSPPTPSSHRRQKHKKPSSSFLSSVQEEDRPQKPPVDLSNEFMVMKKKVTLLIKLDALSNTSQKDFPSSEKSALFFNALQKVFNTVSDFLFLIKPSHDTSKRKSGDEKILVKKMSQLSISSNKEPSVNNPKLELALPESSGATFELHMALFDQASAIFSKILQHSSSQIEGS